MPISRTDNDAWPPPVWAVVPRIWAIIVRIPIIARRSRDDRARSRFLVHVEVNALWDLVGMGPAATGAVGANLGILVGYERECLDGVFIGTEVVKGTVAVAKDFQVGRRVADVFAIGFDSSAGRGGLDQDVVSDSSMRSTFHTRGNGLATSQQAGDSRESCENEVLRFHISDC